MFRMNPPLFPFAAATAFATAALLLGGCGATANVSGTPVDAVTGDAGADLTGDDADAIDPDAIGNDTVSQDGVDAVTDDSVGSDAISPDGSTDPDAVVADTDVVFVDIKPDGKSDGVVVDDYAELLVKVLGPTGREWGQSEGANVVLSGVTYGNPDSMTWSSSNGKSGTIVPAAFWQSDIFALDQGDNTLTVTATKGGNTVSDTIHLTYNPLFSFDGPPTIAPNAIFVGEAASLVIAVSIPGAANSNVLDPNTITLLEVDENGKTIQAFSSLKDDGNGGNCDDVQKDSVYSTCLSVTPNAPKTYRYRVKATVSVKLSGNTVTKYDALSPVAEVDAVPHFTQTECNSIVALQKKVRGDYTTAVAGGSAAADAADAAVAALKADASVAEAGLSASGNVWIHYKSGRLGALNVATAGMRSGGNGPGADGAALPTHAVGTRRALSLAPFATEFKAVGDEVVSAAAALNAKQCPPFAVDAYTDNAALLRYYRDMSQYGVVAITGHGDSLFKEMDAAAKAALGWEHLGSQETIWSGEAVDCNNISSTSGTCAKDGGGCKNTETCVKTSMNGGVCVDHTQADIMTGRVVIGDSSYGFVPSFVRHHSPDKFPASIVYLGTCRSLYTGAMALQFIAAGAAAVVGYSDYVSQSFAYKNGWTLFDGLVNQGLSVLQAFTTGNDPEHAGSHMRLYGDGAANTKDANLINPSWDLGRVTGWKPIGDGRVISRLGATVPVAGKFMGVISTGLGFTTSNGSLEQPFCVDKNKQNLCFFWKFYSEEFIEWCGSQYMDQFRATLGADSGQITMTDVWIDQLCPYDCGNKYPCEAGSASCKCGQQWKTLTQADVSFDQGNVWMTPWQKTCTDVSGLSGADKKVNLKFFATDKGDSIYDTVILLDEVTVD